MKLQAAERSARTGLNIGFVTGAFAVAAFAVVAPGARAESAAAPVTFAGDVAPIIYNNCSGCHRPGQIGPMSLMSYEEVRPWAKSIRSTVSERTMPPWPAAPHYGPFRDNPSLTENQIATLVRWADSGAPRGNPADEPAAPEFDDEGWRMGHPDQIFTMTEEFQVADSVEDQYEHFVIPTNLTEDRWVTSTELRAGAPEVVHHILVFIAKASVADLERAKEELSDEGGGIDESMFEGGLFAKYAPGANPEVWPADHGRLLPAGSRIIFQIHYHKNPGAGTGRIDRSSMAVKYAEAPVKHPITTAWLINPAFHIPAGSVGTEASAAFKFIDDGHIHALSPHLHLRGRDFVFVAIYPDGREEKLLDVPDWDFNWQMAYIFEEPKFIPRGTKIRAVAHWDNSADNPDNPDPTADVYWGQESTAEMMIGFMDYTYAKKKRFQGMWGFPEDERFNPFGSAGQ